MTTFATTIAKLATVPRWPGPLSAVDDATVCAARRQVGQRHRSRPEQVCHIFYAANQGDADLSPHWQPARGAAFGHSKIESTVRYLGIEVDDALEIAEKIDV